MDPRSNEELARLLRPQAVLETETPRRQLQSLPGGGPIPAPAPLPQLVEAGLRPRRPSTAPGPLSQREIDALLGALNRGSGARLQRNATAIELQRLVNAVNTARRLEALAIEAIQGSAGVHWDSHDWVFEPLRRQDEAA
jgi:hypothetical protein